jgi:PLP dependent protein
MTAEKTLIADNLGQIRERVSQAATRCGRRAEEITLVAVSKTFPAEAIRAAHELGLRHFGENRVQEWEGKQKELEGIDATWHLIGHLQSNKARRAANLFGRVDSVDSFSLAQKLDAAVAAEQSAAKITGMSSGVETPEERASFVSDLKVRPPRNQTLSASYEGTFGEGAAKEEAAGERKRLGILAEVHIGGEETKSGIGEAELPALAEGIAGLAHLELLGLMAIPPFFEDVGRVRPFFVKLRALRDGLSARLQRGLPVLSMGMSHDFEIAIEEGATEIRVGTALFGDRRAKL